LGKGSDATCHLVADSRIAETPACMMIYLSGVTNKKMQDFLIAHQPGVEGVYCLSKKQ